MFIERERAQITLNSIGDAVLSTDIAGRITYLNRVAERMTGWSNEDAIGLPLSDVFQIVDRISRKPAQDPLAIAIRENKTVSLTTNCILIRRDGMESAIADSTAPIHDQNAQIAGAVIVFHDVSEALAMVDKMTHLAQHDALTDLPNRVLPHDRMNQAIANAQRNDSNLAVLFIDVDRFKHINDSLGHAIGDKLLQSIAARLVGCVRRTDTVSRQGGDEFVVLLDGIMHTSSVTVSATKMLAALRVPHRIGEHLVDMTACIGISTYPTDGWDTETLIASADAAMYHAKQHGRNHSQFFQHEMNVGAAERQTLESHLHRAIDQCELSLHYQPKVNLETGTLTGAEALLRWTHPERGAIPPAQFIPIAEDSGIMRSIGQWVLREACHQARSWQTKGLWPAKIAVNVSAVEFRNAGFLDGVRTILADTELDPSLLEIELTESVLMQESESTTAILRTLKSMGVQLSVDDFGTGYSSLSYLRRFPIDALKIDRSFVRDINLDPDAATIVSAVINMGKSLRQRVIAEGVETTDQCRFLQDEGCDEGQGYYFGRPVSSKEFETQFVENFSNRITQESYPSTAT